MIKKCFLFLLVMFFLSFSVVKPVSAQSSEQIYNNFLNTYRNYQKSIPAFEAAKSQYLSFQSVDSQLTLIPELKKMLLAQTESMLNFTLFIRTRLVEATSILVYQENLIFVKLDDEITFLNSTKNQIEGTTSLDNLKKISTDLAAHYKNISIHSFQIKHIIETSSANKFLENLKIEKEKITNFIDSSPEKNSKLTAAETKLNELEKDYSDSQKLYKETLVLNKSFDVDNNKSVWKFLSKFYVSLSNVIVGYKNVILSLK